MRKIILSIASLIGSACIASATVTVQGWWHLDIAQPITDSSGNGRTFGSAYSTAPAVGGLFAALPVNNGAGGPLGATGYTSANCIDVGVGVGKKRQSAMWGINYNPPAANYGIEIWVLPQDDGVAGGSGGWIFSSGQSGGVALRVNDPTPGSGAPYIDAFDLSTGASIGSQVPIDTNQWMHLALVNTNGVVTFYTNGVACGPSLTSGASTPAGDVYIGTPSDNQGFYGYLDEARMFTFASGAFTTNDLLLRPKGPNVLAQPQSDVVWSGGAAPYNTIASFDFSTNPATAQFFQWTENGIAINDATNSAYVVPVATPAATGSNFQCIVTIGGISVTSTPPASLTVVPNNSADVAAYQSLVHSTPGIVAYFPVDGSTNLVVTNVIDALHNGTLENDANYDGRTNRSFGQRALSFDGNAVVEVPNNPAFEFSGGFGTIEALVYMAQPSGGSEAIVSEGFDSGNAYYFLGVDATGSFLLYTNDSPVSLSWPIPGGLVGQFADVAVVIDSGVNVTAYVNGQSLGTQTQAGFGSTSGGSLWVGGIGNVTTTARWTGTIDELAIFQTNLPASTIQAHYTKFVFGTNLVPPVVTSQSIGKTVFAGGSPQLTATVTGGLPLSYQWTSNGVPIAGATSETLVLSNSKTNFTATYGLTISNVFGSTNSQPIVMTFDAPPAGYVATVMGDHPTALWRLAETNGPTAVDSAGLNDAAYNSSGVTYGSGGPSFDKNAGALFDGKTGRAVTPVTYPDINPNGPFSVEFWAKLSDYVSVASTGTLYSPMSSMPRPSRTGGWEWYMGGNSTGYEFHSAEAGGYSLLTADNNEPPVGDWWYMTGIWDGTNMYLYVNGQLGNDQIDPPAPAGTDNFATEGLGQTQFVPNTSVPLYIGSRSDGVDYFDGAIADVAFYDYALSPEQVSNHWMAIWSPASVVSLSAGITNVEGSTITITPDVLGLPNTYQWYFGTNVLSDSTNFDGSAHFSDDVTNLGLVIAAATPADSGLYHLVISNPLGGVTTSNINIVITPNTTPPAVQQVVGLGTPNPTGGTPYLVKVVFSGRVDPVTGGNIANYSLSPSATIKSMTLLGSGPDEANDIAAASLGADWREAILVTSGLTPGQQYTLTVSGVKDQSQTPLTIPTVAKQFNSPVLSTGAVNWDYYYLVNSQGGSVAVLQSDYNYVNSAPMTNAYLTSFDTDQITGGELNNVPIFGALGDNYGDVVSGWITPTVSGDYTFFISCDDQAALYLSSDSNPANITQIATETAANSSFTEATNNPDNDSSPITLTAGQSYFIQALHGEGGGGDYVRVAWRISTDSTPAQSLTPIPGSFLSTYQPKAVSVPQFSAPQLGNGTVTLNWSGAGATIQQSTNLLDWTAVPGNPSPLVVPVNSTTNALFFRLVVP